MPLSILLTAPWDSNASNVPPRLEIPKVRIHRLSWKNAGSLGIPKNPWAVMAEPRAKDAGTVSTDDAEVITISTDEWMFRNLHGVLAKDANYDLLAEYVVDRAYD